MWKSVQKQKCKKLYMFMLKLCTATRGQCEKQGEANTVWGSEVMIMQIRSLLWIKTEIWKRLKLCFCHSVLLMNSAVALFCYSQLFDTSHTCTASLHSMLRWCFSQHYASLSLQPLCRWNSRNPLLHSTTSMQGDTSTGPLFKFFSLQV